MPTKQRCKKIRNREQEQEWNFYSNLRTNPQLYEKKEKKRKENFFWCNENSEFSSLGIGPILWYVN